MKSFDASAPWLDINPRLFEKRAAVSQKLESTRPVEVALPAKVETEHSGVLGRAPAAHTRPTMGLGTHEVEAEAEVDGLGMAELEVEGGCSGEGDSWEGETEGDGRREGETEGDSRDPEAVGEAEREAERDGVALREGEKVGDVDGVALDATQDSSRAAPAVVDVATWGPSS